MTQDEAVGPSMVPLIPARSVAGLPGGVRPIDVLRFNSPLPETALVAALGGILLGLSSAPHAIRATAAIGGLAALYLAAASAAAAQAVFGGGLTSYAWLTDVLSGVPSRWVNVTTGFDDTTGTLARLWPDSELLPVDWFDPDAPHEAALLRARALRPPQGIAVQPSQALPLDSASVDAVFLLMAAHEIRDRLSRAVLLSESARVLRPGGRLVITEHARDLANTLAFGPGVLHFYAPRMWRAAGRAAGLRLRSEEGRTPFVRVFVFEAGAS